MLFGQFTPAVYYCRFYRPALLQRTYVRLHHQTGCDITGQGVPWRNGGEYPWLLAGADGAIARVIDKWFKQQNTPLAG